MKIFKYEVIPGAHNFYTDSFLRVLDAQWQNGKIVVWCEVDPDAYSIFPGLYKCKVDFTAWGTGWEMDNKYGSGESMCEYVRTVQDPTTGEVWHVYAEIMED